jgi:hypothetical protein
VSNYDAWKTRSPDDARDRFDNYNPDDRVDEDDECDHIDYGIDADGRRHCERCGEVWRPTAEYLAAERTIAHENERRRRKLERRALWRKVWLRLLGKRAGRPQ